MILCNDELIKQGYTYLKNFNGELVNLEYNARTFYYNVLAYEETLENHSISLAMDYGNEEDVKKALCDYIIKHQYNLDICNYINSVNWI